MIRSFGDGRDWFFKHKLGMFVHWGLYSMPAWHEQIIWRGEYKRSEYEGLKERFNPVDYDPDRWIDLMESCGMTFIVFTAKHHDGFCMFDTQYSDYNIMNTQYGKDVLRMLADACVRRNIKLGIYYSLPDWHHPNYPNMGRHHEMWGQRTGDEPDEAKYLDFVKNQVTELCTNYGDICEFFWDVNTAEFRDPDLNELLRRLQPNMVINDRGPGEGDFGTPERSVPDGEEFRIPTQACSALGRESWGYRKDEDYYTNKFMMKSIDKILCMGGSYLLNMGPCADGSIDPAYTEGFSIIGDWYRRVGESFRGTCPASYLISKSNGDNPVLATRRGNAIYIHLYKEPDAKGLILKPIYHMPRSVTLLNDGSQLDFDVELMPEYWQERPYLHIKRLPVDRFYGEVMVLKLSYAMEDFI